MRVIHVIPSLEKGGAERLTLDICIELSTRPDIKVRLITLRDKNLYGGFAGNIDWQIAPSYVIPSLRGKAKTEVDSFIKAIENFQPDVIHSHLFEAEMVSRHHLFKGVRYFTHCHDNMVQMRKFSFKMLFDKTLLTNYYERKILLEKYRACDNNFIAISKDTYTYFKQNLPRSLVGNVRLLHNAINFKKFNSANRPRDIAKIRMINTGSFVPKKNQVFLVEVMNCLKKLGVEASLTLLGTGPEIQKVKDKVNEYGLNEMIVFAGNVKNVEEHLSDANLYVHSAYYEPFGLVLLEAMASGLPVVAMDGKGNRDLIVPGKNGFLIMEQNAGLFAQKILEVMCDKKSYDSMSNEAVDFARDFDIVKYVDKLLELYTNY